MTTKPTQQHARLVLQKAIEMGRTIDIPFAERKDAESFRFMCYSVRKSEKRSGAKYTGTDISLYRTPFDSLHLSIVELDDGRHAVRFQIVDTLDIEILDAETGAQLALQFEPTPSDSPLDEFLPTPKKEAGKLDEVPMPEGMEVE